MWVMRRDFLRIIVLNDSNYVFQILLARKVIPRNLMVSVFG